jgi:hypothetical protein
MRILQEPGKAIAEMPQPRFAHQVVYNPNTKSVFLHGGNAGGAPASDGERAGRAADGEAIVVDGIEDGPLKEKRLDDFWRMELRR